MKRTPVVTLAFICAVFGTMNTAQAGKITYDWVTPSFNSGDTGVHYTGSITVDSTGISSTPISLTASMIQSWQISVFDSANTLRFALTSSAAGDVLLITPDGPIPGFPINQIAPEITSTSLFLPSISNASGFLRTDTFFHLTGPGNVPAVHWGTSAFTDPLVQQTQATPSGSDGGALAQFTNDSSADQSDPVSIATVEPATAIPEPSSFAILTSAAAFGVCAGYLRKRRRSSAVAV